MTTILQRTWQVLTGKREVEPETGPATPAERPLRTSAIEIELAPNDPFLAYVMSAPGVIEPGKVDMDSPGLRALKEAGVELTVPLISQGELIGLLNLGPRLSEQVYSTDDRRLLNDLAAQAAPAVRVAQLVRQQQTQARERERIEQELRVAHLIQQTLLPKELPALPDWKINAYWQPARAVGGDFYDFYAFPDGRLGLIIGDVTDKGVPAALVMAATRGILRTVAERLITPGQVLERANNLLCPDIPANMFVTCLYAVLDPNSGELQYANAGHCLPTLVGRGDAQELRATGMPLGLMPDMAYEEKEAVLGPGESVLFYSDGLIEAHNSAGEMFGTPRLRRLVASHAPQDGLIDFLLAQLVAFAGDGWEQEDDATFLTLQRTARGQGNAAVPDQGTESARSTGWRTLAEFEVASAPGNERQAVKQVEQAIQGFELPASRLERFKTAVAEATMNGMEHGNQYRPDLPVTIEVAASGEALAVRVTDHALSGDEPTLDPETPDLEAKLAGHQSPRGWGLFLIQNMVDEMTVHRQDGRHTLELVMRLQGGEDANSTI